MEMMQSRATCSSAPGVSKKANIAKGIVWVSPGILDTNVIVAPNSPRLLAKAKTTPDKMPGIIKGKVIVKKTRHGDAPSVRAASSSLPSINSSDNRTALTRSGNATTLMPVLRHAN